MKMELLSKILPSDKYGCYFLGNIFLAIAFWGVLSFNIQRPFSMYSTFEGIVVDIHKGHYEAPSRHNGSGIEYRVYVRYVDNEGTEDEVAFTGGEWKDVCINKGQYISGKCYNRFYVGFSVAVQADLDGEELLDFNKANERNGLIWLVMMIIGSTGFIVLFVYKRKKWPKRNK